MGVRTTICAPPPALDSAPLVECDASWHTLTWGAAMNWATRVVVGVALVALTSMLMYPPWLVRYRWDEQRITAIYYAPIWRDATSIFRAAAAPTRERKWNAAVDGWKASTQPDDPYESRRAEIAKAFGP